jgi:hypothetical protein
MPLGKSLATQAEINNGVLPTSPHRRGCVSSRTMSSVALRRPPLNSLIARVVLSRCTRLVRGRPL